MKTIPIENDFAAQKEYGESLEGLYSNIKLENQKLKRDLKLAQDYIIGEWRAGKLSGPMTDELINSLQK